MAIPNSVQAGTDVPKIVLCMIVKNESKIIRRCLDSARSVIDAISICDTGSTDNTVELIKQAIADFGIPGVVHQHEWKNFGHNRSLSFTATRQFSLDLGFNLKDTYSLLLDADMMLDIGDDFVKKDLVKDGYLLQQYNSSLVYYNMRLVKMIHLWKCIGVTHEYWGIVNEDGKEISEYADESGKKHKYDHPHLETLKIDDRNDGGCKADKFERDIRLLSQGVIDEPDNVRYKFYLARSYEDSGKIEDALEWYQKRIDAKGWWEEVWYSHYAMGRCYQKLHDRTNAGIKKREKLINDIKKEQQKTKERSKEEDSDYSDESEDSSASEEEEEGPTELQRLEEDMITDKQKSKQYWDRSLEKFFDAYESHSGRAEPLYKIANHYRYEGKNELCYLFARMGLAIPYPKQSTLFVEHTVYEYLLFEEIAIAGYYTRHRNESFDVCERMILDPEIPLSMRDHIHRNEYFYIPQLKFDWFRNIVIECPLIESPTDSENIKRYLGLNPSILKEDFGYTMIYRTVNFTHNNEEGSYTSMDTDGLIRTRNYLVKLNMLLKVLSAYEIVETTQRTHHPTRVLGLEDCRIFKMGSRYYFTCTTCDTNPNKVPQITLCRLARQPKERSPFHKKVGEQEISYETGTIEVDMFVPLQGSDPTKCEKNWLPFEDGGSISIIYGWSPLRVISPDLKTGECKDIVSHETKHEDGSLYDLSRFRGSTSPISFEMPIPGAIEDPKKKGKTTQAGYLVVVHEVIFRHRNNRQFRRHYVHRFVWLDKSFQIQMFSRPFYFEKTETEYCCGLCHEHNRDSVLLTAGINDCRAVVFSVSNERVRAMLRHV